MRCPGSAFHVTVRGALVIVAPSTVTAFGSLPSLTVAVHPGVGFVETDVNGCFAGSFTLSFVVVAVADSFGTRTSIANIRPRRCRRPRRGHARTPLRSAGRSSRRSRLRQRACAARVSCASCQFLKNGADKRVLAGSTNWPTGCGRAENVFRRIDDVAVRAREPRSRWDTASACRIGRGHATPTAGSA